MKRALVCAPLPPEFDRESGARRTFDLIMLLRDQGWAVSFLAQGGSAAHERYGRALRQLGIPVYAGSFATGVGDEFTWEPSRLFINGQFDLAILAFWHVAEHYIAALRHHSPRTRVIVDTIDLHFLRNARRILNGDPGRLNLLGSQYGREAAGELRAYASADALLTVSAKEADLLDSLLNGTPPAYVVPDMEDLSASQASFAERRGILLLGSFRHPPNREAAEVLCRSILPRISRELLAEHPVYVVGNGLDDEIRSLGAGLPHVRMVGWVPSVEPYLRQCRITVLPLRHGAGTKRKLVQALMVGTPSVATGIGVEGLGLRHEEHVLVANDPGSFAREVERLMADEPVWKRLAHAGRAHVLARHSVAAVRAAFLSAVDRVLNPGNAEPAPALGEAVAAETPTGARIRPAFPDGHFYSPVVAVDEIIAHEDQIWPAEPRVLGVDLNEAGQVAFLKNELCRYSKDYDYPDDEQSAPSEIDFFTLNSKFTGLDAQALFAMLRSLRPRRMVEIGSGYSSLLTADVNRRFLDNQMHFTCVEPYPQPFLQHGVPGISRLVQQKAQEAPLEVFAELDENDVLFVDPSHVSKTGSDVNHIVFTILPRLRPGVVIHFHDIFFPQDYPKAWVIGEQRSWNEQYLIQALLMGNASYQILFSSHFASTHCADLVREMLQGRLLGGGSLWLRKVTGPDA